MMVKRYIGRTAEEALSLAKWELGEDAVILSSGKRRDRWWKFWENGFSILVAADGPNERAPNAEAPASPPHEPAPAPPQVLPDWAVRLERKVDVLERRMGTVADPEPEPEHVAAIRAFLRERKMEDSAALLLAREAARGGGADWRESVQTLMAKKLGALCPDAPKTPSRVVMVGPTGSGKTTTLVKLAAKLHLEQNQPVLLVTTDTYRLGAIEQMQAFADLLRVPFRVVHRPRELPEIFAAFDDHLILVDTPGHSVRHPLHMAEIRVTEENSGGEVWLTVPATMDPAEIRALKPGFLGELHGAVCITKADEAHGAGGVLGAVMQWEFPLRVVTDGQRIPEDLHFATADGLSRWMMRGAYHD